MGTSLNDILNFIIPIGVWIFIIWIIYRIPIVKEGVQKLIDWIQRRKEAREDREVETSFYKSITYE